MIDPLKIVLCFLKPVQTTRCHPKWLPHEYTRESRLISDEYNRELTSWCTLNKHQNRFTKKILVTNRQGSQCINHRGVWTTWCILPGNNFIFQIIHGVICIHNQFPGKGSQLESLSHYFSLIFLITVILFYHYHFVNTFFWKSYFLFSFLCFSLRHHFLLSFVLVIIFPKNVNLKGLPTVMGNAWSEQLLQSAQRHKHAASKIYGALTIRPPTVHPWHFDLSAVHPSTATWLCQ